MWWYIWLGTWACNYTIHIQFLQYYTTIRKIYNKFVEVTKRLFGILRDN